MIRAVLFDFGGVLAEEGYRWALETIAKNNGIDPAGFLETATRLIYGTGHITGRADEHTFVEALRKETGIRESVSELQRLVMDGFKVRPGMIALSDRLRQNGIATGILSDQTSWLDEIDARDRVFEHFDHVFNSFKIGIAKDRVETFAEVCRRIGVKPEETVFIDDNAGNVERAAAAGLNAVLFVGVEDCVTKLRNAGLVCLPESGQQDVRPPGRRDTPPGEKA
jgi:putative hydrolase of the HAD superfamily